MQQVSCAALIRELCFLAWFQLSLLKPFFAPMLAGAESQAVLQEQVKRR